MQYFIWRQFQVYSLWSIISIPISPTVSIAKLARNAVILWRECRGEGGGVLALVLAEQAGQGCSWTRWPHRSHWYSPQPLTCYMNPCGATEVKVKNTLRLNRGHETYGWKGELKQALTAGPSRPKGPPSPDFPRPPYMRNEMRCCSY